MSLEEFFENLGLPVPEGASYSETSSSSTISVPDDALTPEIFDLRMRIASLGQYYQISDRRRVFDFIAKHPITIEELSELARKVYSKFEAVCTLGMAENGDLLLTVRALTDNSEGILEILGRDPSEMGTISSFGSVDVENIENDGKKIVVVKVSVQRTSV